jgi:hypothetical protein
MLKTMSFYLLYLPSLIVWSIVRGSIIGCLGGIIGRIQWFVTASKEEATSRKRYPARNLKKHFETAQESSLNPEDRFNIECKYIGGDFKQKPLVIQILLLFIYTLGIIPFFILYGVFFQGPISTFNDGIRFWQKNVLRMSLREIYEK